MTSLPDLEKNINFFFKNPKLLSQALTHRSYSPKLKNKLGHNERLEFLGDSVLKIMVSKLLFDTFPTSNEGELSKIRSQLVSDKFLASLAKEINLGLYLIMSYGEEKSGGRNKLNNLANAFEALLGACYLDQGLDAVTAMFRVLLQSIDYRVAQLSLVDYKSELQELTQKQGIPLPVYTLIHTSGPDHKKEFYVECLIQTLKATLLSPGRSNTKKDAEQLAAKHALEQFNLLKL